MIIDLLIIHANHRFPNALTSFVRVGSVIGASEVLNAIRSIAAYWTKAFQERLPEAIEKAIADSETEIHSLEVKSNKVKQKGYVSLEKLNETRPWFTKFSLDVISEINSIVCCNQDPLNFCELPTPFILGRLRRSWSKITWSMSHLWTATKIRSAEQKKFSMPEPLLREWLSRSGTYLCIYTCRHIPYMDAFWSQANC